MMQQPWLAGIALALSCPYWMWGASLRTGHRLIFILAGLFLVCGAFVGGLAGLLFILLAEAAVVSERFLQLKSRTFKFTEREFAGLALYILPLLAMILSSREGIGEAASLLTVFFFCLRLLGWPLSLPFEEKSAFPFHNIFVLYWCNLAALIVVRQMILPDHLYLFLLPAAVNAVTGSVFGAVFLGLAYMGFVVSGTAAFYGPVGVVLAMFSSPERQPVPKRLALLGVFVLCSLLSLWAAFEGGSVPPREAVPGLGLLAAGALAAHQIRKKWLGFANAPGLDVYQKIFEILDIHREREEEVAVERVPAFRKPAAPSDPFVGSLGQYLFWIFLLTIVLVIGGAVL